MNLRIMLYLAIFIGLTIRSQAQYAFNIEVSGKGPALLLIPGYSCSGEVWKETVATLNNQYECHVLTLAGYAGQPAIDTPVLKTVKGDIIRYVKDKKLTKPVLVGHSLGAFMSIWVASEAPELFGKLVCVDGVPFISALGRPQITVDSVKNNPAFNPELVIRNFMNLPDKGFIDQTAMAMRWQVADTARARQIAIWQYKSDRKTLATTLLEMSTTDLRAALKQIPQPVLVMGSIYQTKEQSERWLKLQYEQTPDLEIKVADSKHFIMYDQPNWFITELTAFLNK
ncbi:alpha/beta hydrolase [Flavihumibacter cheonanensis]|uniref:alpha/beta fold hydrolase n=1 Tax=Flavihumibacter cheonanensis TaxID=1442385 RepID=UPI001EF9B647|nr:alpha/beta hydrolase [Flavihumibacter cheonanensis]MCG7753520.1 alpha/beta hydrolase [Flavihumibacter cheonanensis]